MFSLAGADWPEDFALLEGALRERLGLRRRAARGQRRDRRAARRARPTGPAISVVSGTYNAVGARHPDGRVFHLGFWPDGAGGRDLARAGLRAVYHAALRMGPATALTERALALFGAPDAIDLLHAFTRRGGLAEPRPTGSRPRVLDVADAGDAVAQAIVAREGPHPRPPGARVRAASSTCRSTGTRVVLAGGVFGHPTDRLAARRWPSCRARSPSATRRRRSPARCCSRSTALGVERRRGHGRGRPPLPRPSNEERSMGGIALQGVSKVFPGGVVAVDDVDLEIGDGEFMVLVGPSGCGKSTLLRMIAGLEGVSGGTIRIGDKRRDRGDAAQPRHRDGLPELRALPAHARVGQPRVRAQAAAHAEAGDAGAASARSPACWGSRS